MNKKVNIKNIKWNLNINFILTQLILKLINNKKYCNA